MNREEFIQRLFAEVQKEMQIRIAMLKMTNIAVKKQKNAFETLSSDRFKMVLSNN
jgi:hypothetical protein